MPGTLTIRLERPIGSAKLVEGESTEAGQIRLLRQQEEELSRVCEALRAAVKRINELEESIFKGQREQMVRLSVQIARKVLMQKVQEGDYAIVPIVAQALENAPVRQEVVVRLNPADLAQCQKMQQEASGVLEGVKLVGDASIGRAECVVETPKGIIESLIDEHLEKIGEALKRAT